MDHVEHVEGFRNETSGMRHLMSLSVLILMTEISDKFRLIVHVCVVVVTKVISRFVFHLKTPSLRSDYLSVFPLLPTHKHYSSIATNEHCSPLSRCKTARLQQSLLVILELRSSLSLWLLCVHGGI